MEPRILRVGEKVTGRYSGMELGKSRKFFWVKPGEEEFYLSKDVGNSLLKCHQMGNQLFTIQRQLDVYEIKPLIRALD